MHKLLERQLKRHFGSVEATPPEIESILEVIDATYAEADADRKLLERSLDLTAQELLEANAELREERTALERRVAERTESTRRSEARYRDLFEGSRDVIYIASPDGRLLDINPAGVELFGFDSKEEMLETVDLKRAYPGRARLVERLDKNSFLRDEEIQLKTRKGKDVTVLATIQAQRDEKGRLASMLGIVRDVTRQRILERQLSEAQKMEAIGRLAGGVAHDFNNLLTAILGYSDLMREALPEDDPMVGQVDEVRTAVRRGSDLTRQLLAFSRRQVLEPRVMQLNDAVVDLEGLLRRVIGADVELKVDLEEELGSIEADPGQVQQVLMNLAINARDAMPEGGVVRIQTRNVETQPGDTDGPPGLEPGSYVLLEVQDSGIGMDEETREQIFEPFFTTKSSGGTGLGLSTVYGVVRQTGGRIAVRSALGEGTTFCIYLPSVDASPPAEAVEPTPRALPRGDETVLLAEDEPVVRAFVSQFLARQGYTVLEAGDGEEALALAEEFEGKIDLLLSDVVMPRMNGIDLCRQMVSTDPQLKVLLMSGYTGKRLRRDADAVQLDPSLFLQKPFTAEDLCWKVREVLEDRALEALQASNKS